MRMVARDDPRRDRRYVPCYDAANHRLGCIMQPKIEQVSERLRDATRVVAFIGSGFSAESGIKTFRGASGYYSDEEIATLTHVSTFEQGDRQKMLTWYQERRDQLWAVEPNPGHHALARLAGTGEYLIATQNVDGLIDRAIDAAGSSPDVIHLHGSLLEVACHECGARRRDDELDLSGQPACASCSGPMRPGVVWFGEALPEGAFERAARTASGCDVCFVIGTSGIVYPAAAIPEYASRNGAMLVEINPNGSALSSMCDVVFEEASGVVLPKIAQAVLG